MSLASRHGADREVSRLAREGCEVLDRNGTSQMSLISMDRLPPRMPCSAPDRCVVVAAPTLAASLPTGPHSQQTIYLRIP